MRHHHAPARGPAAQETVIAAYEALLERSSEMLDSARSADWEALIDQESRYLVEVERLRHRETELPLDDPRGERKAELLERILEQDLEIRRRLVERRDELGRLIGSGRQQMALSRAYGPQQGASRTIDAEPRFTKKPS
ncbi:flagellar protein FliT [Halomonas sp. C05BenzN]|uniref:flagellar protein FliT n=1 Tax=Halomonas sp. C05BenzN TaxID=3411041 RepID=UPI003B936FBE